MLNLLRSSPSLEDLQRFLGQCQDKPLLPRLGAPAWAEAASNPSIQKWIDPLRQLARKEADRPMPFLTDDLYREFYATGARAGFEAVYFERRRILGRVAVCVLIEPDRGAWVPSLLAKVREILSEFSWAGPAHVNSPSGKDPCRIDIFAAETANIMAEIVDLFREILPEDIISEIYWRLHTQFFLNYLNRHEDFAWTRESSNWNAVCHQGLISAALAVEVDLDIVSKMLLLAKKSLPLFLRGFDADGACSEGPGYWQHGFGAFASLNAQLEARTGGELSLFGGDAHIRQIARYGPRVSLENFHLVNFSDSPRAGALNPALLTYLGTRLVDELCRTSGFRAYKRLNQTGINLQAQRSDLPYLARLILNAPRDLSQEIQIPKEDIYFRETGIVVAHGRDVRGNVWDFAAKGGNNAEHHNHNDCGSFLLNVNGYPFVIEIGAPEYTKEYLREKRYQFLAARTQGHSLPIINGFEQSAGPKYAAKILSAEVGKEQTEFSVDLTACYPAEAHCSEVVRTFQFDKKNGELRVRDFYELFEAESFESALIVDQEVTVRDAVASISLGGMTLLCRPFGDTIIGGVEDHEYRDHSGVTRKIKRIILKPSKIERQNFVGYDLLLADAEPDL